LGCIKRFEADARMRRIFITFAIILVANIAATMVFSSLNFVVKAEVPKGVVSIAFDDNYLNQYVYAFPLLQQHGITGTFYVRTDKIGLSGYMTGDQLRDLESAGNEIGSHSHTHHTFTLLSETEIRNECSLSKQLLVNEGLTVYNFAYPNGPTNDYVDSIVLEYYRSGRTAYIEPYLMEAPTSQFRVAGFSAETASSTTLSLLKEMVDQVQATNGWAIIFFHNIIPDGTYQQYTTSTADFESFLEYISIKDVETLTVNQVLDLTRFSISSNFGTVSPASGIRSLGETVTIEAFPPPSVDGERYVWLGWTGSGSGSYTGLENPASITFNGPINQTGTWEHEYALSILTECGTTSPPSGEHWYEAGTSVTIEAFSPPNDLRERYIFQGWNGTGQDSYSGYNESATIVMNNPIIQTTSWTLQYELSISWSGLDSDISESMVRFDGLSCRNGEKFWLDSDSSHNFDFQYSTEIGSTKRYVWEYSLGLSTQRSGSLIISGPSTLSAIYKTQFLLNVISPYGTIDGAGWYDSGSTAYAILDSSVINETSDVRYLFNGWSESASGTNLTSDPILMDAPKNAVVLWNKQLLVCFDQIGLPSDFNASIMVNSANYYLPYLFWADDEAKINFAYPNRLSNGGVSYVLEDPLNQSSIEIDSPLSVTAKYTLEYNNKPYDDTSYDDKQFVLILVSIILASSAIFIVIWKKTH
jgi:peptidoglycan/xylan/chitin deacetylase (PgdA/CDA1 family)